MKKGINEWSFPDEWSMEKKLEVARSASYDGFEPVYSENGFLTRKAKEKDLDRLIMEVAEHQLEIPSIATGLLWKYSLSHHDGRVREEGKEIVKDMIRYASYLHVPSILIVPGVVDEDTPYDRVYERSQEAIFKLAGFAKENRVTLAIENVWNHFLLSPLEMKRFIEEINMDSVRVYLDVGNILAFGYPEQWIRILGDMIDKVHVKDFKRSIGNIHGFTPLPQGDVNWAGVISSLKRIGYEDYLTVEIPPNPHYPMEGIKEQARALDVIIKGEEK